MSIATTHIALFKGTQIRKTLYNDEWWFSVVDVVQALTEQPDNYTARKYWNKLSQRLRDEGSEVVTKCHRLKLEAADGKKYETDCANTEGIFRIIQSIPSSRAEPFKQWLAKVGYERVQEIEDPELATKRTRTLYKLKGYSEDWIEKRMRFSRGINGRMAKAWCRARKGLRNPHGRNLKGNIRRDAERIQETQRTQTSESPRSYG